MGRTLHCCNLTKTNSCLSAGSFSRYITQSLYRWPWHGSLPSTPADIDLKIFAFKAVIPALWQSPINLAWSILLESNPVYRFSHLFIKLWFLNTKHSRESSSRDKLAWASLLIFRKSRVTLDHYHSNLLDLVVAGLPAVSTQSDESGNHRAKILTRDTEWIVTGSTL